MSARVGFLFLLTLLLAGCGSEADFRLAEGSRPPRWCPADSASVSMSYYIKPDGRTAVFECGGKTLAGRLRGLEPATLKTASAGYPAYEIISVDGVVDIIEHRKMEPVFYTTDDPVVWKNLGIAPASPPDKSPSPYPP